MKRVLLRWVLPFAISAGMLWLAFSMIEEPERIPGTIASVPWYIHAGFVGITLFSFWCRAIRWRLLLPAHDLTSAKCFGPLMIGFLMNALFPARAGEFARAAVLARRETIPFSSVFGSVLLERIFDGVILLASFVFVLTLLGATLPDQAVTFGTVTVTPQAIDNAVHGSVIMVALVLAGIIFVLVPHTRRIALGINTRIFPEKISHLINDQIEKLAKGFDSLRSPLQVVLLIFWTLVVWATVALSGWEAAWGFEELRHMTFLQSWAITVFVCIFILVPASPGYWGLYEIGVIVACATLGLTQDKSVALSYGLVIHFWQVVTTIGVGLIFLWREGVSLAQIKEAKEKKDAEQVTA